MSFLIGAAVLKALRFDFILQNQSSYRPAASECALPRRGTYVRYRT
jgi:hypothetical protein